MLLENRRSLCESENLGIIQHADVSLSSKPYKGLAGDRLLFDFYIPLPC